MIQEKNNSEVAGLMVTYNPTHDTIENAISISKQVNMLIIVDDGSNDTTILDELKKLKPLDVFLLKSSKNNGIAASLNKGAKWLYGLGYKWAVTFDQDSKPHESMVKNLFHEVQKYKKYNNSLPALVSPNIIDINSPSKPSKYIITRNNYTFLRKTATEINSNDIIISTITSGSLTNLLTLKKYGYFIEELFIDYVDTEYCLRLNLYGEKIIATKDAILYHSLGNKSERKLLGTKWVPTNHAPFRRYYIARNSIYMYRKYAFKNIAWFSFDLLASIYNALRIILFEDQVFNKAKFCLKGYWDAFNNKFGKL